jgi:hypothetical protein
MLTEVKIKDFLKLKGIITRNIEACKVTSRTTFEYVHATATLFATQGNMGVWVDDLESPQVLLIVTSGKFGVLDETFAFVNTVYVDEDRRSIAILKEMTDTAAMWAKSKGCKVLQVSSWAYRGSAALDGFWERFGFEIQETIFIKEVK